MNIWVTIDENGFLTSYSMTEQQDTIEVLVEQPPTDFTNWRLEESILVHDPERAPVVEEGLTEIDILRQENEELTKAVSVTVQNAILSDEEALKVADFYPEWMSGMKCDAGKILQHVGELFRINQNHTAQAQYLPGAEGTESLYSRIKIGDDGFEEWKQPTGGHDAYGFGKEVKHKEKVWVSQINGNVYEPGTDDRWWKEK